MNYSLIIHQAHPLEIIPAARKLGFVNFGLSLGWNLTEPKKGAADYGWADEAVAAILEVGGTIGAGLTGFPAWIDPSAPLVGNVATANPAIGDLPDAMVPLWEARCDETTERYKGKIKVWGLDVETNVQNFWRSGDWLRYVKNVLIPASKIIKASGGMVVAPGTTIQTERGSLFTKAVEHWSGIYHAAYSADQTQSAIDKLSFHLYRDTGAQTLEGLSQFLQAIPFHTHFWSPHRQLVWSETGFTALPESQTRPWWAELWPFQGHELRDAATNQAHEWKALLAALAVSPSGASLASWIDTLGVYHSHGSKSAVFDWLQTGSAGNNLFTPNLAGQVIGEYVRGSR